MENLFLDIGIIVIAATILGFVANVLKQPLLLSYIVAGMLLGSTGSGILDFVFTMVGQPAPHLHFIEHPEVIDTLSKIGIVFLLFMVGLELSLKKLKEFGSSIIWLSLGQILLTFGLGFGLTYLLGFSLLETVYIALGLVFSSTIVAVKVLSERKDLSSLYGRMVVGLLLAQDFLAIFALIAVASVSTGAGVSASVIGVVVLKLVAMFLLTIALGHYILPRVFKVVATSLELLFLGGVTMCFLFAIVSNVLDISVEIGAFLAGLSLSSLPYHVEIAGRIKPLRDFFITIFFVILGLHLDFSALSGLLVPTILLTLFVLLVKPVIILSVMGLLGFRKRTSFLTGTHMAHISEFTLIVLALALSVGHVSDALISMMTLVMILSIAFSSYLMGYASRIFERFGKMFQVFERKSFIHALERQGDFGSLKGHTVLCGYKKLGYDVLINIASKTKNYLVVDLDPGVIRSLLEKKVPCVYGDIADEEILDQINARDASVIVSTVPDFNDNLLLVRHVREHNKQTKLVVIAGSIDEALELYEEGASYVVVPGYVGGAHTAVLLEHIHLNRHTKVDDMRMKHIGQLRVRKMLKI